MPHELPIVHRSTLIRAGLDDREQRRSAARGSLIRVAPGTYAEREAWDHASARERYVGRIRGVLARLSSDVVVSHESAAALLGLPSLSAWPPIVHVIDRDRTTARRNAHLLRHSAPLADSEVVRVDGIPVTSPVRTAVDLALGRSRRESVVVLDDVLHGRFGTPTQAIHRDLVAGLASRPGARGSQRAAAAVAFADSRSDSPGESVSRVFFDERGAPPPALQKEFRFGGITHRVDFFWERYGIVGEFDGLVKYRDRTMRNGRTLEQVMIDEKLREDRIRSHPSVKAFVRWVWRDLEEGDALIGALESAGLPILRGKR